MSRIIAIVGMCGVGKSVAVDYFTRLDYRKVYFGGITLEKVQELGMEVTPENEKTVRENLRKEYGMGAYAVLSLPKIKAYEEKGDVVIDGLYSWDELKVLKEEFQDNLVVIAIIADKHIRYLRLSNRDIRPHSKEQAQNRDIAEIENMAKGGPIAYADYFAINNGTTLELEQRLEEILEQIKK